MIPFLRPLRNLTVSILVITLIAMWLTQAHFGRVPVLMLVAGLALYATCYLIRWLQPGYREQAIAAAVVISFYFCSAITSVKPEEVTTVPDATHLTGFYQGLTESLLKGQLTLPVKPEQGLINAANPYAPGRNYPFVWDASYYQGKYYIYFGLTPVMTLFLPFRVLTQRSLPNPFALLIFLVAGFIGSLFALDRARRRCGIKRPTVPIQVLTVLLLGFASMSPLVLRRPAIYEVAISSAYCFSMWGLYSLIRYFERQSSGSAFLASLFFALTVGSRPTYGVLAGLLAIATAVLIHSRWKLDGWAVVYRMAPLWAPIGSMVFLIGLYNKLRFDDWTEFGLRYQLDHLDMYNMKVNVANALRGAAYYLFSTPLYSPHFPGIHGNLTTHPFSLGRHPGIHEDVIGVFGAIPVTCFVALGPLVAWYRKSRWLFLITAGLTGFAGFMVFAVSNIGVSARYELDFVPSLLLASTLAFYGLCSHGNRVLRAAAEILWVPAACFSITVGIMASVSDFQNSSLQTHYPSTYRVMRQLLWPEGKQFDP
ncbi:MAG TPA: hypothetical protein VIV60_13105 [Polyangiaceae bacterium]